MRGRLRRIPPTLALILAIVAVLSIAWMIVMPPFQGPDEATHFAYTQKIVESHVIPFHPSGGNGSHGLSSEVYTALTASGMGPLERNVAARPYWTSADTEAVRRALAAPGAANRTDGGYTTSNKNPPLYYLYAAVPYAVAHGGSVFDRAELMRLANVPLLLVALVFVWLLIGELAGRGWPQVLGTTAAALLPELQNMAATVNPDVLLVAEWSAALYLIVLVIRRGPRPWLVGWLGVACAAAVLTHVRSVPLLVPAAAAVLIALARERGWQRVTPVRVTVALTGAYLVAVLALATYGRGSARQFVSYLWQFYLPRLGFMTPSIDPSHYGFRLAIPDRLYSNLAQLEVTLPHSLESAMYWISLGALVALVIALIVRRRALRAVAPEALVLALAVLALLVGLHIASYRSLVGNPSDPIFTARYLLPLLPLFGLAIVVIAKALPRAAVPVFCGLVLGLGALLQLESLGLLVERFYA